MSTTQQSRPTLDAGAVAELRAGVRGEVLTPGDAGYDAARTIWNGMFDDLRPAVVVRCAGVADVIRAVGLARSEGLEIAVRGGGHSIPGFSAVDGGIVIDLGPMKGVRVDPATGRVTAQAGLQWHELDHETQAFGLATTGGIISTTGVSGFTLGGGIGHLVRPLGLACDRLIAADVVTADGRLVRAGLGAGEDVDLLWALKGGGGDFGIVTSLEFQAAPIGPMVYGGAAFFEGHRAAELARFVRDWAASGLPDELTPILNLTTAPPAPFLPEEIHGRPVAILIGCWAGAVEEGERQFAPVRDLGGVAVDLLGPIPYVALQQLVDPLWTRGARNHMKAGYLADLDDGAVDALVTAYERKPAPQCELHVHVMGGAAGRVPADASAFAHRAAPYVVNLISRWEDPAQDEACLAWGREGYASLAGHLTGGAYINFLDDEGAGRVQDAYGPEGWARLQAIKAAYDPDNVFHRNQNITPAG
ncbi:FAD-binding oxidoreductase [Baekduia soli]|uniref:FAD-binding oxidoreductase n=1 Tax=Baekduia soli TaxID=496014 RepID=A0A5B8U3N3_9ACTN|nr:FAD-binding oxidoreductase [Baekduia soli]QEC47623.1 FAD-binding oxidoreductase [Baekduia soli]